MLAAWLLVVRRSPRAQLAPIDEVMGWRINVSAMSAIDRILARAIPDPVGPEFMAPPDQLAA
jgi:hypothetical protein